MSSQQQNPPEISHSLQQQIGVDDNTMQRDIRSFSIRQYVLASRQKDVLLSWPFPEKYLQICFKHGISNVLPPLESRDSTIYSVRRGPSLKFPQQNNDKTDSFDNKIPDSAQEEKLIKHECDSCSKEELSKVPSQDSHLSLSSNSYKVEENNHLHSDIPSDITVPHFQPSTTTPSLCLHVDKSCRSQISPKKLRHKRKRCKGKRKKRSMVDILATAKHSTLEDLYRINSILSCGSAKSPEHGGEQNGQMIDIENNSKSELTDECVVKNCEGDDFEAANLSTKKQWVLKFKFSGHKPK